MQQVPAQAVAPRQGTAGGPRELGSFHRGSQGGSQGGSQVGSHGGAPGNLHRRLLRARLRLSSGQGILLQTVGTFVHRPHACRQGLMGSLWESAAEASAGPAEAVIWLGHPVGIFMHRPHACRQGLMGVPLVICCRGFCGPG